MKQTKIEWCDHTWSPWRGCTKVSPGCANCYAEDLANRFGPAWGGWGKGSPRIEAKRTRDPERWDRKSIAAWDAARGNGLPFSHPPRPTVFPSLCDWLDPEVPAGMLARFLALIQRTPNLTWLLLTKRPAEWRGRLEDAAGVLGEMGERGDRNASDAWGMVFDWLRGGFPHNVWLGTSVEDQARADERIPHLLDTPAAGRFLSVEPLLGEVDLRRVPELMRSFNSSPHGWHNWLRHRIHWVIIGGESGTKARPCDIAWVRSLVRQCRAAGVPPFVKQFGARPVGRWTASPKKSGIGEGWPAGLKITHAKGGDPDEWPEDLRVREFPEGLR